MISLKPQPVNVQRKEYVVIKDMALPIPEKKKRRGVAKRVKLPINMSSKYQKKCPICRAPYVRKCLNCGYIHEADNLQANFAKPK